MHRTSIILAALTALGIASLSPAPLAQPNTPFTHGIYGTTGRLNINQPKAIRQGTGSHALTFEGGYYGLYDGLYTMKAGIYLPYVDDKAKFSQTVDGLTGDDHTFTSHIAAWGMVLESGLRFPVRDAISLGTAIGYRSFHADRSIFLCSGCRSDNIGIDGGLYLRPYINAKVKSVAIEVSIEEHLSGDFSRGVIASVIYRL